MDVRLLNEPQAFLELAGDHLAAEPVRRSIVARIADRCARRGMPTGPFWFAVVLEEGRIVGTAMRTHPEPPHAPWVCPMPEPAVQALVRAIAERGEQISACNGDLDAGRSLLEYFCGPGQSVAVQVHLRLFELERVVWPVRPEGTLRRAVDADADLVLSWCARFHHDAEQQAGRTVEHSTDRREDADARHLEQLANGEFWLWEVSGVPVHLTAVRPAVYGVSTLGPVYTPESQRGHGYAGWTVATCSQQVLDAGNRPVLYTDQANPVSNKVYERIGYVALGDDAEQVISAG